MKPPQFLQRGDVVTLGIESSASSQAGHPVIADAYRVA